MTYRRVRHCLILYFHHYCTTARYGLGTATSPAIHAIGFFDNGIKAVYGLDLRTITGSTDGWLE